MRETCLQLKIQGLYVWVFISVVQICKITHMRTSLRRAVHMWLASADRRVGCWHHRAFGADLAALQCGNAAPCLKALP